MKASDTLRQKVIETTEEFEESVRHYCDLVDEKKPWLGNAYWDAAWQWRKEVSALLDQLQKNLHQARFTKDPG